MMIFVFSMIIFVYLCTFIGKMILRNCKSIHASIAGVIHYSKMFMLLAIGYLLLFSKKIVFFSFLSFILLTFFYCLLFSFILKYCFIFTTFFNFLNRKGYGRLLISFSYELSKKEEKVGE